MFFFQRELFSYLTLKTVAFHGLIESFYYYHSFSTHTKSFSYNDLLIFSTNNFKLYITLEVIILSRENFPKKEQIFIDF